jgi:hypothetical protein
MALNMSTDYGGPSGGLRVQTAGGPGAPAPAPLPNMGDPNGLLATLIRLAPVRARRPVDAGAMPMQTAQPRAPQMGAAPEEGPKTVSRFVNDPRAGTALRKLDGSMQSPTIEEKGYVNPKTGRIEWEFDGIKEADSGGGFQRSGGGGGGGGGGMDSESGPEALKRMAANTANQKAEDMRRLNAPDSRGPGFGADYGNNLNGTPVRGPTSPVPGGSAASLAAAGGLTGRLASIAALASAAGKTGGKS